MNRIDNPDMWFQSCLNHREMVQTNMVHNPDTTYVTLTQYNELKAKYENRGKVIKKLRKKIARLESVIKSAREYTSGVLDLMTKRIDKRNY